MATRKPTVDVPVGSTSAPPDPTAEEMLLAGSGTGTANVAAPSSDAPTMAPPGTAAAAATAAAAGWLTNKKVLMLYQRSAPKDGWIFLDGGTGWKQILQADDLASRGIGELAAGGRAAGSLVHAYEGPTGTIDSFYLW